MAATARANGQSIRMFHELFVELGRIELRLENGANESDRTHRGRSAQELQERRAKVCQAMERLVA